MFNLSDTIAAICTPPGKGAISAIRISGNKSWDLAKKIFLTAKNENFDFKHLHALYGVIKENEKTIDEVIILPYKAPQSFTSEDVIEIFCHGGNKVASMILDLCLQNGARRASGGEFTFRAFINGRIDLTEAEAINEIINAETSKLVYSASDILCGSLKHKVESFKENLLSLITSIEGGIEFPMDVSPVQKETIIQELKNIKNQLDELVSSSRDGMILRQGIKVSIVGVPNVGKSSLLNQLLENQRAIVTAEPGTTRDTIEEKILIDDYPIILIDTAGIRNSDTLSTSEKSGIERSKSAIEKSDIILYVFDLMEGNNHDTKEILNLSNGKLKIIIGNKLDLKNNSSKTNSCDIAISAKFGTNIDLLKKLIVDKIKLFSTSSSSTNLYINDRQKELLLACSSSLEFAIDISTKNASEDLIADELKKAVSKLDELTGKKINELVIENIFAKFCIGK